MPVVHIILAIERPLFADVLCRLFAGHDDLRVEAQVPNELEAAVALRQLLVHYEFPVDDPLVVITLITNKSEVPAVCLRLIHEFPEVFIFGIDVDSGRVRSFHGSIQVKELQVSLDNLVQELRSLITCGNSGDASS